MPPNPSHPYVDSVSMAGKQIKLSVEVTDFMNGGGSIEISGQATQSGGGCANIYQIVDVTKATQGDTPGEWFVTVTADTIPPYPFRKGQDVTVFIRTARVWSSVLGEHTAAPTLYGSLPIAGKGTTWDVRGAVTQVSGQKWSTTQPPTPQPPSPQPPSPQPPSPQPPSPQASPLTS
jgi:hypothetical protein